MSEVQQQIFSCLRRVSVFANQYRLEGLQVAIDQAEDVAILEVLGIDVHAKVGVDDQAKNIKDF